MASPTGKPSLSIVIAAYNEEGNLQDSIQAVVDALQDRFSSYEILVVDDGSIDGTSAIVQKMSAANPSIQLIQNEHNSGMGFSLWKGMRRATKDYVTSFPGDNGLDGKSFAEMLQLIGQADVIGYYIANPEFRSMSRRFISHAFTTLMNALFGLRLRYYNGHAIYKAEHIKSLKVQSAAHSLLAEVLIRLLKAGRTYKAIPTIQHERKHGTTKAFRFKTIRSVLVSVFSLFCDVRVKGIVA